MRFSAWTILAAFLGSFAVACGEPECRYPSDCTFGYTCVANACVKRPGTPIDPIGDASTTDRGFREDATPADTGTTALDAGFDGGVDASLDATVDAGPDAGFDAGVIQGPPSFEGTIWVAQENLPVTGTIALSATGETFERSAATATQAFSAVDGTCRLEDRRYRPLVRGIGGGAIRISGFPDALLPGGELVLRPTVPGRFLAQPINASMLFVGAGVTLTFAVPEGSTAGQLAAFETDVTAPPALQMVVPLPDSTVDLRAPVSAQWVPHPGLQPPVDLVFELSTDDRSVVLRCATDPGKGGWTMPAEAIAAYLAAATRSTSLAIRLESERLVELPIVGGGAVKTFMRASAGRRYITRR